VGRSLSQLRAALFAGEPLTSDERQQLAEYDARARRFLDAVREILPAEERTRTETGDELEDFLAEVYAAMDAFRADVNADTSAVMLARMKELIAIVRLQADVIAQGTGKTRRVSHTNKDKSKKSTASKRAEAEAIRAAVDAYKAAANAKRADEGLPRVTDEIAVENLAKAGFISPDGEVIFAGDTELSAADVQAVVRRVERARHRNRNRHQPG
jgi:hypothetical protein